MMLGGLDDSATSTRLFFTTIMSEMFQVVSWDGPCTFIAGSRETELGSPQPSFRQHEGGSLIDNHKNENPRSVIAPGATGELKVSKAANC